MKINTLITAVFLSVGTTALMGCATQGHGRSTGAVIDDASITTRVKATLLATKDINSLEIKAETFNGIVQLSGFVESQFQIDRAGQVVAGIEGVKSVKNDLIHKSK